MSKINKLSIDPIEANKILVENDLLNDNINRPGKPLRDLLRKGLLPHAYQTGGKGSSWVIPLSNKQSTFILNYQQKSTRLIKKKKDNFVNTKPENIDEILKEIEKARLKYKPDIVKYLLIAEAPPNSLDRFFYFENVKKRDYLFLGIAQALYPKLKNKFLADGRNEETKKKILEKLKLDGFYLIDLSDLPLTLLEDDLKEQLPNLKEKIEKVIAVDSKIIIIKANVYDLAYQYLVSQEINNVVNRRIAFPSTGGQKKFQSEFSEALKEAGYK